MSEPETDTPKPEWSPSEHPRYGGTPPVKEIRSAESAIRHTSVSRLGEIVGIFAAFTLTCLVALTCIEKIDVSEGKFNISFKEPPGWAVGVIYLAGVGYGIRIPPGAIGEVVAGLVSKSKSE